MEDPISFDIYGKIHPEKRSDAVDFLMNAGLYPSEIEVRKAINHSIRENAPILLARTVNWSNANAFQEDCLWARDIELYQAGYRPGDTLAYCAKHHFHYGGILGCHVCNDFYQK